MYVCGSVCHVRVGTRGSQGRVLVESLELELTGHYEPPKVSAEI